MIRSRFLPTCFEELVPYLHESASLYHDKYSWEPQRSEITLAHHCSVICFLVPSLIARHTYLPSFMRMLVSTLGNFTL